MHTIHFCGPVLLRKTSVEQKSSLKDASSGLCEGVRIVRKKSLIVIRLCWWGCLLLLLFPHSGTDEPQTCVFWKKKEPWYYCDVDGEKPHASRQQKIPSPIQFLRLWNYFAEFEPSGIPCQGQKKQKVGASPLPIPSTLQILKLLRQRGRGKCVGCQNGILSNLLQSYTRSFPPFLKGWKKRRNNQTKSSSPITEIGSSSLW